MWPTLRTVPRAVDGSALFASKAVLGANLGANNTPLTQATQPSTVLSPCRVQLTDLPYFASKVVLGPEGVQDIPPLPALSPAEQKALEGLKAELQQSIAKGIAFANAPALVPA